MSEVFYEPKSAADLLVHYAAVHKRLVNAAGIGELKHNIKELENTVLRLTQENSGLIKALKELEEKFSEMNDAQKRVVEIQIINTRRTTMASVINAVVEVWHINKTALFSSRRGRDLVTPRHIGMALCTILTSASLPEIGRMWGDRDHTTVLHARDKYAKMLSTIELAVDAEPSLWVKEAYNRVQHI